MGTTVIKLKYTLTHDILFKMLFVKQPKLLKHLVAALLGITFESIQEFTILNPEILPDNLGDKYCKLDINMTVNGQRINLEVQVRDDDFPDRPLYYWAREFSSALPEGERYRDLPRTVSINILGFKHFACKEYFSNYVVSEITRHTLLTDKLGILFYELPKLPKNIKPDNNLELWLSLLAAKTESAISKIQAMEVPIMEQTIQAYRSIAASPELKEIERLRHKAHHDGVTALAIAEERGEKRANARWQTVVDEKDALIAKLLKRLGEDS